ncbi:MAG: translational GTPase TypA [Acidobacteria bacterium]|nr:translational GTPase TypA [Acidobacteriota bacterium]
MSFRYDIRNVAIIAHVDHGKTTLVDALLRQTGAIRSARSGGNEERVMDSNDLEKERGITILAKNASLIYRVDEPDAEGHPVHHEPTPTYLGHTLPADFVHPAAVKINIVDTPGHADFGGEVERSLSMVDGVILLVDAAEGPMPQTRFVLRKALALGLLPTVIINKIDRADARPNQVVDEVFDLMVELGASDEQLDFPILFASGRSGYVRHELHHTNEDVRPLLDVILQRIPPPLIDTGTLQMLVSSVDYDDYVGRLGIGRIRRGTISKGETITLMRRDGATVRGRVTRLVSYEGLEQTDVDQARAGDIVAVSGFPDVEIGETLADGTEPEQIPPILIDEPTVSIEWVVNDSPFAGRDGKYVTFRKIVERLEKEARRDVALRLRSVEASSSIEVSGRGELHLSILAEKMRREGYEFCLSRPQVVVREIDGVACEPWESLVLDVPEESMGAIMETMQLRRGEVTNLENPGSGRVRIELSIPTRGLFGMRTIFLSETRGTGIMYHTFEKYAPVKSRLVARASGALIAKEGGDVTAYAIEQLQERSTLFVSPGDKVYAGQVVGENARDNDMVVQICRQKHLTNMRASGSDIATQITPPTKMSLERCLEWIEDDELAEVTPTAVRLRKRILDHAQRKIVEKKASA